MPDFAVPICYVGEGLGSSPRTPLNTIDGEIHWDRFEKRVRMVPAVEAERILRENPQDFRRCVKVADGHGGFAADQLLALAKAKTDAVHVESYHGKAGAEPEPVLVLDEQTAAGIAAAKKAKKKGKEE